MFPVLFAIGPFQLRTLSFFLVLSFLLTAFLFWKKTKEEHYSEVQLFDGFLLASMVGLLAGRVGYVISQLSVLGFSVFKWVDIFGFPGINGPIGVIVATIYLYRYAKHNKWDEFEILDFWVLSMAGGLALGYVGLFFDGTSFGLATQMPWGMVFPGLLEPHHPVQLYFAVFFFILSWYLARVEYKYRTFEWYRAGKKTAQTGFLLSIFVIVSALFFLIMTWFKPPLFAVYGINADRIASIIGLIYGVLLLVNRSGRTLWSPKKKSQVTQPASEV